MKIYLTSRSVLVTGFVFACACSSESPVTPSGTAGTPGTSGSPAAAGQASAGTGTTPVGGSTAGTNTTPSGAAGLPSAGSGAGGGNAGGGNAGSAGASLGGTSNAGASGAGGAAGGAAGGWVSILPKDETLTGWVPYLKGYDPGTDPLKTFRRDPATGALVITYADYPDGGSYGNHLGLIYYDKKLTNYRVRIEYSFQEPQAKAPVPSWGKNNSGLFVFGTDPHLITGNPDFPTAIEIQLLGKPSAGGSVNCQICLNSTPGMYPAKIGNMNINGPGGCFASTQNQADFQNAATWTTVEAEVDGSATGVTKIYQYTQDGMKPATPIQTFTGPVKTGNQTVNGGWISFQSESQPVTFRKIDLMELP